MGRGQPIKAPILEMDLRARRPVQRGVAELSTTPRDVYITFFTTMFLHGGWVHLLMNMWMLWIFGNNIEDRLGHFVYVAFYLMGGIVATLVFWYRDRTATMPVIGASGAVAAVLGGVRDDVSDRESADTGVFPPHQRSLICRRSCCWEFGSCCNWFRASWECGALRWSRSHFGHTSAASSPA